MFGNNGQKTQDFTVPAGDGDYATEILYLRSGDENTVPASGGQMDKVSEYQLDIEALPATAQIEVDLLLPGKDPATAANWNNHRTYIATGIFPIELLTDRLVRVRAKSGGTSGTAIVGVSWA